MYDRSTFSFGVSLFLFSRPTDAHTVWSIPIKAMVMAMITQANIYMHVIFTTAEAQIQWKVGAYVLYI